MGNKNDAAAPHPPCSPTTTSDTMSQTTPPPPSPSLKAQLVTTVHVPSRVVFISVIGLCETWKDIPYDILCESICVLPLNREWIVNSDGAELQRQFPSISLSENRGFLNILKWKYSQGMCFFLNETEEDDTMASQLRYDALLADPVWIRLDAQLRKLGHNGLLLDDKWWKNDDNFGPSKYGASCPTILCELYFATIKYKSMQEMFHQSNPGALLPIVRYIVDSDDKQGCTAKGADIDRVLDMVPAPQRKDWWVAEDYDYDDW